MSQQPIRPLTVTLACVFLGMTSALWLFFAGSLLSSWTTLQRQQEIREALSEAPMVGSLDTQVEILRVTLMSSAALAAAAIILAVYTARGHRASRILLTVQAVVLAVVFGVGGAQGLIPSAFAIACIFLLWNAEARRWFATVNGGAADEPSAAGPAATERIEAMSAPGGSTSEAPATEPGGPQAPAGRLPAVPGPTGQGEPVRTAPAARRAAIIAIIGSSFGALFGAFTYVLGARHGGWLEEQLRGDATFGDLYSGLEDGVLAQALATLGGSMVALSLFGLLAAVLLLNRRPVGRILLYIASAGTIAMAIVTIPLGLVTAGLAIYVIVLLSKPEVGAWLAAG